MCPSPDCKHPSFYRQITDVLNDSNLTQTVSLPTRDYNILDLFFTTNPTLVQRVSILPYKWSCHCSHPSQYLCKNSFSETTVYIQEGKLGWDEAGTRSLPWGHAWKWKILLHQCSTSTAMGWPSSLTNKVIPSKLSSTRNNLPWVNQKLKRIVKQGDRAFQKHRKSGKPADRKEFLDLKHLFRKSIKLSYQSYLEDILDVASSDLTSKPNTKKILTLLKHSKQDSASVTQTQFCPSGRPHESHYS